ncbi:MAG: MmgE/PrpD family protein [Actinomycetota bacterium]|nr:MmgE/PrpD family protein [Actinomycetota bacterium]
MSEQETNSISFVKELIDYSTLNTSSELLKRLEVLLADFMVCVSSGNKLQSQESLLKDDGSIGLAARLASQSAFEDRDDLDWSAVNHPGSVVFATSFAIALEHPKFRENFLTSALAGMRASASAAHFFGPNHRKRWHITATAGTFGAVCAASAAIELGSTKAQQALHLAGTNMGGTGQVSRELQGTPRFNRSAAAALGVASAFAAYEGMPALKNLWLGDRGLFEVFDLAGVITDGGLIRDGISTVRVRTFPATGFIQSALFGVAKLAGEKSGDLLTLNVEINAGVFPILNDPERDRWWNLKVNVASAWRSKNPMDLTPAPEFEELVTVNGADIALGTARISGSTTAGQFELFVTEAPGLNFFDPTEALWREEKWRSMIGEGYKEIVELARALISKDESDLTWSKIEKVLR